MYEEFFGLERRPFASHPDATCIHWTMGHQSAFATLQAGIARLSPITLVTGEVGCGKTTLIRHFLETAPVDLTIGLVSNFVSGNGSVLEWTLMAFDQEFENGSEPELLNRFQQFTIAEFAAGRRTALIVDEAQNISAEDLECLRLLSNVNADGDVLLLMFLVGQPELRQRIADPKYRQIVQRIGSDFHLSAMTEEETADYVRYLLEQAGAKYDVFDEEALSVVYAASSGIPRKINLIADLCMVTAFAEERRVIGAELTENILADLHERGIFASLTMPMVEVSATPVEAPEPQAVWVPKLVDADDDQASNDNAYPKVVTESVETPVEVSLEPANDPGAADRDRELVGPSVTDNVQPPVLTDDQPSVTAHVQSQSQPGSADAGQVPTEAMDEPGEKSASDTALRANVLSRPAFGAGWHRYAVAAVALLAVGLGASFVDISSETSRQSGDPDQTPRQLVGNATPTELRNVATSGDDGSLIAQPAVLKSVIPSHHAEIGNLRRQQAQAGVISVKPHAAIPATAARPGLSARPKLAAVENEITATNRDAMSPAHRYPSLAATLVDSMPARLEIAVKNRGPAVAFNPQPPTGPIVKRAAASTVELILPRTSSGNRGGQKLESLAVVHDHALRELRPALRVPFELLEVPTSAGGIVWHEASVLAVADASTLNQGTLARFKPDTTRETRTQIAARQIAMLGVPDRQLARAKRSVRLGSLKDALALLTARDPLEAPRFGQAPANNGIEKTAGDQNAAESSGDELFKMALALSPDDPTGAAVLYTRAALRGHKRSAYYLGQIYETGDGVSVDFALARAWYTAVGPGHSRAERRIRALPEPDGKRAPLSAPVPLWVERTPDGTSEFVWTSGQGGDADMFFVQVASSGNGVPEATYKVALSGAILDVPSTANFWRVLTVDPASAAYAASEWFEITKPGEARTLAGTSPTSVNAAPSAVIAHAPGSTSARVEELSEALALMRIQTRVVASPQVVGTGNQIHFFYSQDRDAADAVAELFSEDAESSVMRSAPGNDVSMALPGEILVVLDDSRR